MHWVGAHPILFHSLDSPLVFFFIIDYLTSHSSQMGNWFPGVVLFCKASPFAQVSSFTIKNLYIFDLFNLIEILDESSFFSELLEITSALFLPAGDLWFVLFPISLIIRWREIRWVYKLVWIYKNNPSFLLPPS